MPRKTNLLEVDAVNLAGVDGQWVSVLVPDKLDDSNDNGQQKTTSKDDEDAADIGHRQSVGVFLAFLIDIAHHGAIVLPR